MAILRAGIYYVGVTCLFVAMIITGIGQIVTILSVHSATSAVQSALAALSTVQFTAFMWPDSAALRNGTSFDFIIAGGGVAGSILANRLTESGNFTVLLIEAGGDPELEATSPSTFPYILGSDCDWSFTTEETNYSAEYHSTGGIYYPAGKMLGGSGALFLNFHTRADPACYDSWATALNDSSWSYNSTLPYFIKSESVFDEEIMISNYESYHGTNGPIGLTRILYNETMDYLGAFAELGNKVILDKNGRDNVGYIQPLHEIVNESIQHPGRVYLLPVKNRPNLYVLKNTLATRILFNENKNATSIEVLDLNDNTWVFTATKEIIVSAGALKSPQLLMLSGIGPKEHLEYFGIDVIADLPVGQDFQDLYGVMLAHQMEAANASTISTSSNTGGPVVVGFSALNKSHIFYPDYMTENYILPAGERGSSAYCSYFLGFNNDICGTYLDIQATNDLLLTFLIKLDPKSRGQILLQSRDPTDAPLIYGGFLNNLDDQADLVEYLQDYTAVVNSTYFRSIGAKFVKPNITLCDDYELYSTDYWNCYIPRMVISIFKYMSTCPMGTVVDTKLKVKGVQNLRVVDASVFPNATRAHPIATVVMIAEKAADMILDDY